MGFDKLPKLPFSSDDRLNTSSPAFQEIANHSFDTPLDNLLDKLNDMPLNPFHKNPSDENGGKGKKPVIPTIPNETEEERWKHKGNQQFPDYFEIIIPTVYTQTSERIDVSIPIRRVEQAKYQVLAPIPVSLNPNGPVKPVEPDEPTKPVKPDEPVKPVKPVKPDEPIMPVDPKQKETTEENQCAKYHYPIYVLGVNDTRTNLERISDNILLSFFNDDADRFFCAERIFVDTDEEALRRIRRVVQLAVIVVISIPVSIISVAFYIVVCFISYTHHMIYISHFFLLFLQFAATDSNQTRRTRDAYDEPE